MTMDLQVLFPPATARLSSRGHSRSPSRSPTRGRITDDILADLSPDTTLESFTNASGALRASIEAASPSQRAFGIRAAVASKRIQEWLGELTGWQWPEEAGFEQPHTKRRRTSVPGDEREEIGTHGIDATRKTDDETELDEYWGSLPASDVLRYELRIEEIEDDMEDLDVEEIKSQVLTTHALPGTARPSSPSTPIPQPVAYTRMEDFTAVVTATVLQALPNLSRLMALMDIWSVRLLLLRQIPPLLRSLTEAELALKAGWLALRQKSHPIPGLEDEPVLSRENYKIMRGLLQDNVTLLGQKLDSMLDSLEGRRDTIPEQWLDRMEAIEQDYGEWVVSGDRKVREGEWAREAARQRAQKLTVIPEDDGTHDLAIIQVEAVGENLTFAQPDDVGATLRNTQIDQLVEMAEKRNSPLTTAIVPKQTERYAVEQEMILEKQVCIDVPAQDSIKSTEVHTVHRDLEVREIEPSVDTPAKDHVSEAPDLTSMPGPQSPFNTEEHIWLGSPLSPVADTAAFDGTRDYKPASIPLETLTPDGTPILNATSDSPGNLSNYGAARVELPPSDLINEVNKTNALQKHDFTPLDRLTHEPTTPRDAKAKEKNSKGNPYMELQMVAAPEIAKTLTSSHPLEKSFESTRQVTEDRNKQPDTPRTPTKVPRFEHPFANVLRATSSMTPAESELGLTPSMPEEMKNLAREDNLVPTQIISPSSEKNPQHVKKDVPESRTGFAAEQKYVSTRVISSSPEQKALQDVRRDVPEEKTDLEPEELPVSTQVVSSSPRQEALQDDRRDMPEEKADLVPEELAISTQVASSSPRQEVLQDVDKDAPETVTLNTTNASDNTQPSFLDLQSSVLQQEIPGKRRELISAPTHLIPPVSNPEKSSTHSRQISTSSTISGYSASDPSPEICEAAEAYFSPVLSPTRQSYEHEGVAPTHGTFSDLSCGSDAMSEERPETPKARTRMAESSSAVEHINSAKLGDFGEHPDAKAEIASQEHGAVEPIDPQQVYDIERPRTAVQATANNQTPDVIYGARSPIIDEESYADFDESPSLGRARVHDETDDYTPPNSPPQLPSRSDRRPSNIQIDPYDAESLSSESPLTPSDSTFISRLELSAVPESFAPMKVSDDQLQQQISEILESIPARIRLTSEPMSSFRSEIRPVKQRSLINLKSSTRPQSLATSRPQSRAATPSFTLAPAQSTQRRPRPQPGAPEIKLYHLSRSTGEAPIKLFVRLVGEHGERVMVRVGGGWADLGEYLKEYAAHHGRRPDPKGGKVEIQDLPPRTVSSSSMSTVRNNDRSSPIIRPGSSLERPGSSFAIRKTRQSVGADDSQQKGSGYGTANSLSNSYRSPSTPLPSRPLPASRQVSAANLETPPSATYTPTARSSSGLSWTDEDSSLGLAGPKSRKTEMSAENAAWVESMKEKVRIASAEKDREKEREVQRQTSGGTGEFGEIGRVGATKRLFVKKGGPGGSGSGSGSGSLG